MLGRNVVSTSQPLAAQAGLRMLLAGGNAVDAAIAAAMTLTVVEPTGNGLGSDAFAILWDGKELHGLNASGRSPAAWTRGPLREPTRDARRGLGQRHGAGRGVGLERVVAALRQARRSKRWPSPRFDYARHGFAVSPTIARLWAAGSERLGRQPGFADHFMPDGRAPRAGEIFKSEAHASTLEQIADSHGEAFYRGVLAQRMAAHAKANGGALTEDDLAAHVPDWCGTIAPAVREFGRARDPAERPGHRGADGARHAESLGVGAQPVDHVDTVHLCSGSDEARVRRPVRAPRRRRRDAAYRPPRCSTPAIWPSVQS